MNAGDIFFLYSDGVYDGIDDEQLQHLEGVMLANYLKSAKDICNVVLEHATKNDYHLRHVCGEARIDDKTVFIIKRE